MSGFSDYMETMILNWIKGTNADAAPAAVYVGLVDGDPGDDGAGGTEVTGTLTGDTNRVAVTLGAVSTSGAAKAVANSTDTVIAAAADAGASATHMVLYDAQTIGTGNLIMSAPLTATKTFNAGDEVKFTAGTLIFKAQ